MQKYQQIEFTGSPHDGSASEQRPDLFQTFAICEKLMNETFLKMEWAGVQCREYGISFRAQASFLASGTPYRQILH